MRQKGGESCCGSAMKGTEAEGTPTARARATEGARHVQLHARKVRLYACTYGSCTPCGSHSPASAKTRWRCPWVGRHRRAAGRSPPPAGSIHEFSCARPHTHTVTRTHTRTHTETTRERRAHPGILGPDQPCAQRFELRVAALNHPRHRLPRPAARPACKAQVAPAIESALRLEFPWDPRCTTGGCFRNAPPATEKPTKSEPAASSMR